MKDQFITVCQTCFVTPREEPHVNRHPRQQHDTVAPEAIPRRVKAMGRLISRAQRQHKPVHIPALNGAEWGQLLRSLEIARACI
jgi:hypoxanthine-guanine phosphoribosyltransferase